MTAGYIGERLGRFTEDNPKNAGELTIKVRIAVASIIEELAAQINDGPSNPTRSGSSEPFPARGFRHQSPCPG
jgi:hypothetical protein